ncbi:MAG TPA: EAL domain-containing protein [Capsulimonadaceae bacterium]
MVNELTRLSALYRYQILDTPSEEFFDRITVLAAEALECPIALLSFVDRDRVWFKSRLGFDRTEIPRPGSCCDHALKCDGVSHLEDLHYYPGLRDSYEGIDGDLRFYAGAPLRSKDGFVLGMLCVCDTRPRTVSPSQESVLQHLADMAMAEIEPRAIDADRLMVHSRPTNDATRSAPSVNYPTDVLVAMKSIDGHYEYLSGSCEVVTGYTPDEMKRMAPDALYHPDDVDRVREESHQKVLDGQTCVITYRGRRKDGVYRWLETLSTPIYDGDGSLSNILTSTRDITARKVIEQRLVESEERFRSLYDYNLDAVFSLDLGGRFESVNKAFKNLVGYKAEQLKGRSFLPYVDVADRNMVEAIFDMTAQGEPLTFEMTLIGREGKRIPTSGLSVPSIVGEQVVGVYLIARDATVQKRIDTLLREENEVLGLIAARVPLPDILNEIARTVDALSDGASSAIILVDRELARLKCVAAPNLPGDFVSLIASLPLAATSGSGGAAIHRNERVISDIAHDPNWEALRDKALHAGLRACWSAPIMSSRNQALGALDVYFHQPRTLRPDDVQLVSRAVHLARIAIEREQDDQMLKHSENRFRQMIENGADVITVVDQTGTIKYLSPSAERVLGHTQEMMLGTDIFALVHPDDLPRAQASFVESLSRPGESVNSEFRVRHTDGSWRSMEASGNNQLDTPAIRGVVINSRDVTERRKAEEQLDYLAYHDVLTDLPNRLLFNNHLYRAIERARREAKMVGVVFLDLDRFKIINDTLGHAIGDLLLRSVSQRLLHVIRNSDTVARWGGDEFTIILPDLNRTMEAIRAADKIINALSEPFVVQGHELYITATAGISLFPDAGEDVVTLVRNADVAMYRAKDQGTNYYQVYSAGMTEGATERLAIENELRKALDRNEFMLQYQPQVDVLTGKIVGVEALLRWKHPDRGLVSPGDFIPLAEETGQIVPIGEWVLRTACEQTIEWQEAGIGPLRVSVNLSARQLRHRGLIASVKRILTQTGLNPDCLEIELTESVLIDGKKQSMKALNELKSMGVHLAIDDFGTGYSSFMYLKSYPVDTLKIDQSFVRNLGVDTSDTAIAQSIISMARSLKLTTIAEGVETAEQFDILRHQGCDIMQGYFFSAPLSPVAVTRALEKSAKRLETKGGRRKPGTLA